MPEIKLTKRVKYAGDVHTALMQKLDFDPETAAAFCDSIPDADAVEVVHGEWDAKIMKDIGTYTVYWCSACNNFSYFKYNYCPNCGAKMKKEQIS